MTFQPLVPMWVLVLVALAAALLLVRLRHAPPLLALRLLAVALLVALAANPVRVVAQAQREPPALALVLDASGSMGRVEDGVTRLAQARDALERVADGAGARWRPARHALADALRPGEAPAAAGGTDFGALAALAGLPPGQRPEAIVIASDGVDRGDERIDRDLATSGIPVFAIAVGGAASADNAAVRLEAPSPSAFVAQELGIEAVLTASGGMVGRQAELIVSAEDGRELLRRNLTLQAEQRVPLTVSAGDAPGERVWRATLSAFVDEATPADNASAVAVRVVADRLRVLLVEGQPWWDTGFAVRAWRRDSQLQVGGVYRIGKRAYRSGEVARPLDRELLAACDVVALGCRPEELVDPALQEALAAFVDGGGGLLLMGIGEALPGPLAALDPLLRRRGRADAVVPLLADAGRRLALLPADQALPSVGAGAGELRAHSELLVGSADRPLVAFRRHGAGRVASVNADGLWRWSLGDRGGGESAARFWRQLVKALSRKEGALASDRGRYLVGQQATIACGEGDGATLAAPGAAARPLGAGAQRVQLDAPGLWRVAKGAERLTLVVEPDVRELVDTARRGDRLARLAAATGGAVVEPAQAAELGARLARRADLQVEAPRLDPLVTRPWWLLAAAALLAAEWYLRRRRHGVV